MLDSMEEATLDDLLRDISSMTDSAMQPLTVSMVVEVDDARKEDEVGGGVDVKNDEEDELMKQLDLVLDDKFYGAARDDVPKSSSIKQYDEDEDMPALIFDKDKEEKEKVEKEEEKEEDDGQEYDVKINLSDSRPEEQPKEGFENYDMRVSIGFTDKSLGGQDGEESATAGSADDATAGGDAVVDAIVDAEAAVASAPNIKASSKSTPKRVVRPKPKRPEGGASGGKSKTSSTSSPSSKDASTGSSTRSPTSPSTTKSPPSKPSRGTGKRSGIPKPGYQQFQP